MSSAEDLFPAKNSDSWRRMLFSRPLPNMAARVEKIDGDGVAVYVKNRPPLRWLLLRWIARPSPERRLVLDRLGTQVWRLCDGKRTVEEIVDSFASLHGLTFHESRAAVTGYLKTLIQRGALAIAMPDEETR